MSMASTHMRPRSLRNSIRTFEVSAPSTGVRTPRPKDVPGEQLLSEEVRTDEIAFELELRIMNTRSLALMVPVLAVLTGCNQGTPGGEGVTANSLEKPRNYGEADNTFNLSAPRMSTTLHQGETKVVTIGIERGKNFDQDVALEVAEGSKGVTVDSAGPVIKRGDKDTKLTFKAADDASLGDFTVKVVGHPAKGADATIDFKMIVAKK